MVAQHGKYTKNHETSHFIDELYGKWIIIIKLSFKKLQRMQFLLCLWFLKSCPKNTAFKINEWSDEASSHCDKLGARYGQPGVTMEKSQSSAWVRCLWRVAVQRTQTRRCAHILSTVCHEKVSVTIHSVQQILKKLYRSWFLPMLKN